MKHILAAALIVTAIAGTTAFAEPQWKVNAREPRERSEGAREERREERNRGSGEERSDAPRSRDPERDRGNRADRDRGDRANRGDGGDRGDRAPARPIPAVPPPVRPDGDRGADRYSGRVPLSPRDPPAVTRLPDRGRDHGDRDDRGRNDRDGNREPDRYRGRDRDHDRNHDGDHDRGWDRDRNHWRDDRGRDWHHERGWYDRYRNDHFRYDRGRYYSRTRFYFGYYYSPRTYYSYTTRAWRRGDRLPFAYFDDRYFIDDYWRFDLYDPPYRCRWLRVRGDALLVDIDNGEVLEVVYELFW